MHAEPVTVPELAENIRDLTIESSNGYIKPEIEIIDKGIPFLFTREDKKRIKVNIKKVKELLQIDQLKSPREFIRELIKLKMRQQGEDYSPR